MFCACLIASAANAQQGRLLVAQKGDRSLAIVDPSSSTVLANVAENGITGHEVAASPDGRFAYVPVYGNSGVGKPGTDGSNMVVIDISSAKLVGNVDFGHPVRPHLPVIGPKDGLIYVTTELDKSITLVDPNSLKIVGSIPTGQPESHMLALSHDGKRGYTANVGPGTVSVLDIAARKVIKVIPVSGNTQRISVSPDDHWVFTADQTQPRMAVIDTTTNALKRWIPLAGVGYGSTVSPDGRWLLVALSNANEVAVIDLATMAPTRNIAVPASPQAVVITPDGKSAFVSCAGANQVAQIDLGSWRVTHLIATGKGTDGMAWAGR